MIWWPGFKADLQRREAKVAAVRRGYLEDGMKCATRMGIEHNNEIVLPYFTIKDKNQDWTKINEDCTKKVRT